MKTLTYNFDPAVLILGQDLDSNAPDLALIPLGGVIIDKPIKIAEKIATILLTQPFNQTILRLSFIDVTGAPTGEPIMKMRRMAEWAIATMGSRTHRLDPNVRNLLEQLIGMGAVRDSHVDYHQLRLCASLGGDFPYDRKLLASVYKQELAQWGGEKRPAAPQPPAEPQRMTIITAPGLDFLNRQL